MNVNNILNKRNSVIFLSVAFILATILLVGNNRGLESQENIHYKLVDDKGINRMFIKTNQSKVTFYLKIIPNITKKTPALFTIFMNGRQVKCLWDGANEHAEVFFTKITPKKDKEIKITIDNIPKGLNTLQFGTLYFPNQTNFIEDDLYNEKYSLDLTPFTIVRDEDINWSEKATFINNKQPSLNKKMPIGKRGELSASKDDLYLDLISSISQNSKKYYFWQNIDKKVKRVRFSLLINWKQVPWPSGDKFIDVSLNPGDVFLKEIMLSDIVKNKTDQLSVVAFINPDVSFWYWDKNNDLKATDDGAQAYATLRNIINSN